MSPALAADYDVFTTGREHAMAGRAGEGWGGRHASLPLLDDADVRAALTAPIAVEACRRALVDAYQGTLAAPPRIRATIHGVDVVVTAGGYERGAVGFRAYGAWPGESDQVVLVWDDAGSLRGIVVGSELGARRTGALGGVAASALARDDAKTLGVLGSGRQAWSQAWAVAAVRSLRRVIVHSPTPDHRRAFAARVQSELGVAADEVASADEVVAVADILVVATRSERPVFAAEAVRAGTHITTVGPKSTDAHELPAELADAADVLVSDSPAQAAAYPDAFFTQRPLTHLGAVLTGEAHGRRRPDDLTVYCSTGLAGSEVVLADALLERRRHA